MTLISPAIETADALKRYYVLRAGVAAAWVAAAFTLGAANPVAAAILLVLYPAWDAFANAHDAQANGGFRANVSQTVNLVVSAVTSLAVLLALREGMHVVLAVFGAWAILAGLLQLATGVRRWRAYGAQWAMILSGAQSALAGAFFVKQATGPVTPSILTIAPYAAFGAIYFLVAAIGLAVKHRRRA
ncbi:membrane protein [soil metagenome]